MVNLIDIFESIEQFAYKVLVWIVLAPKTLARIVIEPDWVPDYITGELREKEHNRFDNYFPPVFLIILVSLLPFIYFKYYAKLPGVVISGPRAIHVGEIASLKIEEVNFVSASSEYPELVRWTDNANTDLPLEFSDKIGLSVQYKGIEVGEKLFIVTVESNSGEEVAEYFQLYVAEAGVDVSKLIDEASRAVSTTDERPKDMVSALKETETIVAALFFLGIPMLFALIMEVFRGRGISGELLRRSYLIQCYYFSPLYIAIYAALLAPGYLLTNEERDIFVRTTQLILLYILFWLMIVETRLIAAERNIHWSLATITTLVTMSLLMVFIYRSAGGDFEGDTLRIGSWYFFTSAGVLLVIANFMYWLIKTLKKRGKH